MEHLCALRPAVRPDYLLFGQAGNCRLDAADRINRYDALCWAILCRPYLCLISGMLIQLAAATAAKGTNRPIRGEMCYSRREVAQNKGGRNQWKSVLSAAHVVHAGLITKSMAADPRRRGGYIKTRCRRRLDEPIPLSMHLVLERSQLPLWWRTHKPCRADCKQESNRLDYARG